MGQNFMLSDFMGCDSVYRLGIQNSIYSDEQDKLDEGRALVEHLLDPILEYSRLSISYGYISDSLSRQIVKYQDPTKPSYHRWDAGAAADIKLHSALVMSAPIEIALKLDNEYPMSRTITYSESPFICAGVRKAEAEKGKPRRALYENRYIAGEKKPDYIRYPENIKQRDAMRQKLVAPDDWRGAGYPTYHGGGRKQLQHYETSLYTVLTDFLYSDVAVVRGYPNLPDLSEESLQAFMYAGQLMDFLYENSGVRHISILSAYESPEWSEHIDHFFETEFYLVLRCPEQDVEPLMRAAFMLPSLDVEHDPEHNEILIGGKLYEETFV
jgi:hypothetical protein